MALLSSSLLPLGALVLPTPWLWGVGYGSVALTGWLGGFRPACASGVLNTVTVALLSRQPAQIVEFAAGAGLLVALAWGRARAAQQHFRWWQLTRNVMDHLPGPVAVKDLEGRYVAANELAAKMLGRSEAGELLGQTNAVLLPEPTARQLDREDRRVLSLEEPQTDEEPGVLDTEADRLYLTSRVPFRDEEGQVAGLVTLQLDVTEARTTEEALRHAQQRFGAFMHHLPGAASIKDPQGRYVYANRQAERLFRVSVGDWRGKTDDELFEPELAQCLARQDQAVAESRRASHTELAMRLDDGYHHYRLTQFPLVADTDDPEAPVYLGGLAVDMTASRQAEQRAAAHHAVTTLFQQAESFTAAAPKLLEQVCEALSWDAGVIWKVDNQGSTVRCAQVWQRPSVELPVLADRPRRFAFSSQTGGSAMTANTVIAAGVKTRGFRRAMAVESQLDTVLCIPVMVGKSQDMVCIVEFFARQTVADVDGQMPKFGDLLASQIGQFIERKRIQRRLHRSQQELAESFDQSPVGLQWIGPDGKVQWANQAQLGLIGRAKDDYVDHPAGEVFPDPAAFQDLLQRVKRGEVIKHFEARLSTEGGAVKHVLITAQGHWERGRLLYIRMFVVDFTEQRQAEEQLEGALREQEILLKEIHHRVKNNLQVISSLLNLQADYVKDHQAGELLRVSQNRIRSIALIHEILYSAKDGARIDMGTYVKSLAVHLFKLYGLSQQAVNLKVEVEPVLLNLDTAMPCGLLINELVSNAMVHAFPDGKKGTITISLRSLPDGHLQLVMSDTGRGLPLDLDWRNPASLGLRLVQTLAAQLGGTIELDRLGGTTFRLTFTEVTPQKTGLLRRGRAVT